MNKEKLFFLLLLYHNIICLHNVYFKWKKWLWNCRNECYQKEEYVELERALVQVEETPQRPQILNSVSRSLVNSKDGALVKRPWHSSVQLLGSWLIFLCTESIALWLLLSLKTSFTKNLCTFEINCVMPVIFGTTAFSSISREIMSFRCFSNSKPGCCSWIFLSVPPHSNK